MTLALLRRRAVTAGDEIATNQIGTKHHQLVHLADATGAVSGVGTNPAEVAEPDATTDGDSGSALTNSYTFLSAAGTLFEVSVILDSAVTSPRWLFCYDATSVTGNPFRVEPIPPGGGQNIVFGKRGRAMLTGITFAVSDAIGTYSAPASSEGRFHARWTP